MNSLVQFIVSTQISPSSQVSRLTQVLLRGGKMNLMKLNQSYAEKKDKGAGGEKPAVVGSKRMAPGGGILDARDVQNKKEVSVALTILIKHDIVKVTFDQK